ncbi:SAF domain-containing protein [Aestuariimicrobium sp. Y1814]|uniref:SAF domain-containing protein n=1 Tax=Aestuariimicrobium sp. Y1814 TaxID=3418742 RepID=UPI003DA72C3A
MSDINGALTAQRTPSAIPADSWEAGPVRAPGAAIRGRRSPRLVLIGVLCAVLGALGVTAAFTQANQTHTVVAMARSVPRGVVVQPGDLTTVTIGSVPGVSTVPADQLTDLIGQTALVDLPQGTLVGSGAVGTPVLDPGTTHLGLKLGAGRLPDTSMPPGTKVVLVAVSSAAEGAAGATASTAGQTFEATLVSVPRELPDGTSWVLDVSVSQADAATIAELAAAGRLVLARSS